MIYCKINNSIRLSFNIGQYILIILSLSCNCFNPVLVIMVMIDAVGNVDTKE